MKSILLLILIAYGVFCAGCASIPLSATINTDAQMYLLLAEYYENQRAPALIDRYYRKAKDLSPNSGQIYNNYGVFLCRQGLYKQARKQFLLAMHNLNYAHRMTAYQNLHACQLLAQKGHRATYKH